MIVTDDSALIISMHRAHGRSLAERVRGWLAAKPTPFQGVPEAYLTGKALPWLAGVQADSGGWPVEVPEAHPVPVPAARRAA